MGINIKNKPSEYEKHLSASPISSHTAVQKEIGQGKGVPKKIVPVIDEYKDEGVQMVPADKQCRVDVSGGQTISLGNFEFLRIDVKLSVPCAKGEENEAFDYAFNWVGEKITKAVAEAKGH